MSTGNSLDGPRRTVLGAHPVAAGWYVALLVAYLGLGLAVKSVVLNGIVGPLFPLLVLCVVPHVVGSLVARVRRRR